MNTREMNADHPWSLTIPQQSGCRWFLQTAQGFQSTPPRGGRRQGLAPFTAENGHDLLEVLEDRHGVRSTVVTSQLPVDKWHDVVGDPTVADAILDRLVHNAYKLDLKGESMRMRSRPSTRTETESHDFVPRRFPPTGDRFAPEQVIDLRRNG